MAPLTKSLLKFGVVVGTVPTACIALGYRMRAVQASENSSQGGPRVYRACDLPIYNSTNNEMDDESSPDYPRNAVEEQIRNVRQTVQGFITQYKETYTSAKDKVDTGVAHSKATLDFVQNNPGELPRVAFITVGSLGGFILGYRGSIVRRLFYGSVAGFSCAALCYPKLTVELTQQATQSARGKIGEFKVDELTKGNWPFVKDESADEEFSRKLGLPRKLATPTAGSEEKSALRPMKLSEDKDPFKLPGDPGQSNPEDKDLYSTRSS